MTSPSRAEFNRLTSGTVPDDRPGAPGTILQAVKDSKGLYLRHLDRSVPVATLDGKIPLLVPEGSLGAPIRALPASTVWFPLNERSGTSVFDWSGNIQADLQGGGNLWGPKPGVNFAGNNYLQVAISAAAANLRQIGDLSTLQPGESVLVWYVLGQPAVPTAGQTPFLFGRLSGAGSGWGTKLITGSVKFAFTHRGNGGSNTDSNTLALNPPSTGGNFLTAVCFQVFRPADRVGYPSCLQIRASQRFLDVPGAAQGINRTDDMGVFRLTGGATDAALPPSDTLLTIGASPTSAYGTVNDYLNADSSLLNLGFQRQFGGGYKVRSIVRDLSRDMFAFPQSAFFA